MRHAEEYSSSGLQEEHKTKKKKASYTDRREETGGKTCVEGWEEDYLLVHCNSGAQEQVFLRSLNCSAS